MKHNGQCTFDNIQTNQNIASTGFQSDIVTPETM